MGKGCNAQRSKFTILGFRLPVISFLIPIFAPSYRGPNYPFSLASIKVYPGRVFSVPCGRAFAVIECTRRRSQNPTQRNSLSCIPINYRNCASISCAFVAGSDYCSAGIITNAIATAITPVRGCLESRVLTVAILTAPALYRFRALSIQELAISCSKALRLKVKKTNLAFYICSAICCSKTLYE